MLNITYHQEMQIKTTVRYHLTLVRMAIIKKTIDTKCWWRSCEIGTFVWCWQECKLVQLLRKKAWRFLKKLKIQLPYDPKISLEVYIQRWIILQWTWKWRYLRVWFHFLWIYILYIYYILEHYSDIKKEGNPSIFNKIDRWTLRALGLVK